MEKIIKELINIKENYNNTIEDEIYGFLNYENEYRDLTDKEIDAINKARKICSTYIKGLNI